ncbi:MAG: hypothetical protein AAFP26_00240 [Planctomycetota bacterium]
MTGPNDTPPTNAIPPTTPGQVAKPNNLDSADATGGLIPYKNGPALAAYYCGIFLFIFGCVGLPVGIVAIVLGVKGLKKRKAHPAIAGSVHAWIGIVLGSLSTLLSLGAIGLWLSVWLSPGP